MHGNVSLFYILPRRISVYSATTNIAANRMSIMLTVDMAYRNEGEQI